MSPEQTVVCTIISKNYLAHARTFTDSFLKNNPNGKVFLLLVDSADELFEPKKEKFTLVNLEQIGIEDLESFCFKYTILEQNTGAKAHFLKYLFETYKLKKLAYFDPDILFSNSLENLWKLLDQKSIVLTPHVTEPIKDSKKPSEFDILRSGSYNLGFIALADTETTKNFLDWWKKHLLEHAHADVSRGLFNDQKWIDMVPSLFEDVYIIKHPGYNVAYWNLMQRKVEILNEKINVNGKPLYFFHFSGFHPENMKNVSKHQNRFSLNDLESAKPLFELYRDLLIENGYLDVKKWKCKFNYFDNGIRILDSARKVFADALEEGKKFKNPFSTTGTKLFINYLNENVDKLKPEVTRLWSQIYKEREDLHEVFPNPLGNDREAFVQWIQDSLEREYDIDRIFLLPINQDDVDKNQNLIGEQTKSKNSKNFTDSSISTEKLGINVAGYLQGEFGVAESVRNYVSAIKNSGIPLVLNNITAPAHRNKDKTFSKFEKENPHPINLVVVNADQTSVFYDKVGADYFKNRYNIGLWVWELSKFPEKWFQFAKYYNEIWTPSSFSADSISKSVSIPVHKIITPIEISATKLIKNRQKFGLEDKNFVFLFIFDFLSIFERKNPLATIEAFKLAFTEDENAILVIKCINADKSPEDYKKLVKESNRKNIKIISEHLDKSDIFSLIASSDCYVSLHRSEGFGLTIAQAMYAEKPVIATSYGGNIDFMNGDNSFPVKYKLIPLEEDYGEYKKGNVWAEPDLEHASTLMRYVFENQEKANEIGENASAHIKKKMNFRITGEEIFNRINKIGK